MITSLLIANRGEIACRIIATARKMGIRAVAVYSQADAHARHVHMADEALPIGPAPARDSYLDSAKLIAAALESGAQAVHPGYGFLSENAEFARSVLDAGLVWIGPSPASIAAMGRKDAAKALMEEAGVPVIPGYRGANQGADHLLQQAEAIGWPVLIKAVAGGGGKGMRLVEKAEDFAAALASCQRESERSFGNAEVLIERAIAHPRHIEVQIFGDSHGGMVHLFERDCSLQRRHQKVIEEAPAPGMDEATRQALCAMAIEAGRAVDYVGAGTVEFIADTSEGLRADRIWFMEMNTRLQVEHPVTEAITGVDLVEWQIRVASGEPLPLRQDQLTIHGHAIEARLYAEDPVRGFLPSIGTLHHFRLPDGRVDTGFVQGDEVTPHYDPMLAKLIHHGPTRAQAIEGLRAMAAGVECWPVKTNAGFLTRALADGDFPSGKVDTGLIARRESEWAAPAHPSPRALQAVAHATLPETPEAGPWGIAGLRLGRDAAPTMIRLSGEDGPHSVELGGKPTTPLALLCPAPGQNGWLVSEAGQTFHLTRWRPSLSAQEDSSGILLAPMPGVVVSLAVSAGDTVRKGQVMLTLEAMKMEQTLFAPFDGMVAELAVKAGQQVAADAMLARIEKEDA
ncbi:MAG: acetyl/propionyl/methylcrotonyl-CoA carboxylase subunit alpha [Sphingomonadales bacterium]|nr:acetyl/propionyl/methylcrotonyl-CoA carboxylase subunit alpha [Sphingomonadales bacterium]MDE2172059.1 acetyl/propionyl/methylcrotonyl-CoA carboxylase subunit alpha [Sphingomonadales bacterium]